MGVKPLFDRVLIRPDKAESSTNSGLILTSTAAPTSGVVVGAGPGRYSPAGVVEKMEFAEGDHVMWQDEYGVEKVKEGGEELLLLRVYNVVAKF